MTHVLSPLSNSRSFGGRSPIVSLGSPANNRVINCNGANGAGHGSKGRHVSYQVPEAEEGPAARAGPAQD